MLRNWLCVLAFVCVASAHFVHRERYAADDDDSVDADDSSRRQLSNKTPKMPAIFSDACEECQVVIRKLAEVAQDPGKVAELKAILLVLCDETSYKDECRIFVNRIDLFLDKLLPYLKNPRGVCHRLHICGNAKLQSYHHIGMHFAKKYIADKSVAARTLLCDECHFAVNELKTFVDDRRYQQEVKEFLSHEVCAKLGGYRGTCDELLETFLPDFWAQLQQLLKDGNKFCEDLKLCKTGKTIFFAASIAADSSAAAAAAADASSTAEEDEAEEDAAVARKRLNHAKVSKSLVTLFLH